MRASSLNRRITIQRAQKDTSFGGSGREKWVAFHECWAEMRQLGGREFLVTTGSYTEKRRVFFIRWRADIRVSDRLVLQNEIHNIVEVREIGRRDGLEIHTVANANQVAS